MTTLMMEKQEVSQQAIDQAVNFGDLDPLLASRGTHPGNSLSVCCLRI